MNKIRILATGMLLTGLMTCMSAANAQTSNTVQDSFTGGTASAQLGWASFNGACLTAGTGTSATVPGIPACSGLVYYGSQTQVGLTNNTDIGNANNGNTSTQSAGALRLTNLGNQNGAIVSTIPFSSTQGLQVTFTTYTYGGDSGGTAGNGADGIGFYLINGNDATNVLTAAKNPSTSLSNAVWNLGAFGGSLGYSCSNSNNPHDGMTDAYLGLGIDEYGNFLNTADNTASGDQATSVNGGNGATYQPQRIGLRGYGSINSAVLQGLAGSGYTVQESDVQATCKTGIFSYVVTAGYTTYTYAYTYTVTTKTSSKTKTYSGTLYQQVITQNKNGSTTSYKAAGTTVSAPTQSTSDGYTGGDSAPYALDSNGSYYPISVNNNAVVTAPVMSTPKTVPDYAVVPNGYFNLPTTTPIANESTTARTSATPISYKLQITQDGLLSLAYSYNGGTYTQVLEPTSIATNNGTMPSSFLFGFGGSTGGSRNVHEITCFQATPANLASSSAGINVQQTAQVETGTQIFLAYYHPNNWWGELDAQNLLIDPTTGEVAIQATANWDASCVLTGGACPAISPTATNTAQGSSARQITWSGGPNDANPTGSAGGIPFNWGRLTPTEQGWLNDDGNGSARVDYLNGIRTNEIDSPSGSKIFRTRTSVLADIFDSSPTWVGPPSLTYPAAWKDLLYPTNTPPENSVNSNNNGPAQTYTAFQTAEASRINVVYAGANDGFMHGFEAGFYNADGTYAGTTTNGVFTGTLNDGTELAAYMPEAVVRTIHNSALQALDYSSTHYSHNYFVDSTPGTGDLFYGGTWHTWLVSGLGAGGNAIFALDITDLGNTSNSTTFGAGNARGEWSTVTTTTPATQTAPATTTTTTTLGCAGDTTTMCGNNLGQTYGTPQIRRLHNGLWAIIFGNGLNSVTGHAGIYIMTISGTGQPSTVYFLDTGVGSTTNPNGIAYVTPVDLDGDHITDYVYAGDVLGNVWRFDLTNSSASKWAVSTFGSNSPTPLFTTPSTPIAQNSTTSTNQPITTQLVVLAVSPSSVAPSASPAARIMVEFGTGLITPQTATAAAAYAPGQQTLYGIWDWDMGVAGTPGASYAGVAGTSNAPTTALTTSLLQQQTITSTTTSVINSETVSFRTVSNSSVCFVGSSCTLSTTNSSGQIITTTAAGTQFGWYMNLPGFAGVTAVGGTNQTEQVIYNPVESVGAFLVDTTIPSNNSPLTCSGLNTSGWTMALNPANGGAFTESFFSTTGNGQFGNANGLPVSGIALGITGSPSVVSAGTTHALVGQTGTGVAAATPVNPPTQYTGGRLTWIELH